MPSERQSPMPTDPIPAPMTREAAATLIDKWLDNDDTRLPDIEAMQVAVAELRRTCATCQHFLHAEPDPPDDIAVCLLLDGERPEAVVPADGSGFCHRHEPLPTPPEATS
jgi:hypothetical protein